jgi:hypothetical protein
MRLFGDGTHGPASRIQTFRCQACRTTFTARCHTPLYRLKTPSQHIGMVRISREPVGWTLPRPGGSSAPDKPPSPAFLSREGSHAQTLHEHSHLATSCSRISSWTNCARGCTAPHRCCGCGWPSTPSTKILPVLHLGPRTQNVAHKVIHSLRQILAAFLHSALHQ